MYRTYNPQPQPQPTPNLKRPDNGSRRPPPSDAISMISMAIGSRLPNHQRRIACGHSGPLVYLIGRLKVNYNLFNFINIYCRVISGVARHRQSPNEIIIASRMITRGKGPCRNRQKELALIKIILPMAKKPNRSQWTESYRTFGHWQSVLH